MKIGELRAKLARSNKKLTPEVAEWRRKCPRGHAKRAHARARSLLRGV